MVLTINVAVLLTVIIVMRLRRRTHARSRNDEKLTVAASRLATAAPAVRARVVVRPTIASLVSRTYW